MSTRIVPKTSNRHLAHIGGITQRAQLCGLEPKPLKKVFESLNIVSCLLHKKEKTAVSDVSHIIRTSGRNDEMLSSVTNRRYFLRHGMPSL